MVSFRHLRGWAPWAVAGLFLNFQAAAPAATLIPLMEGGGQIGTFEWPREDIRILEPTVGEIDPSWVYEGTITGLHISSGKMALPAKGRRMPAESAEDAGIKLDGIVKLTVTGPNAESFTAGFLEGTALEIRTVIGESGLEVNELVLGLPREAIAGVTVTATLKLDAPASGVLLPVDALWTQVGDPPTSYVFPWNGREIRRLKVTPGLRTDALVEIPEGVLPGERFLAGELQELYTRFELKAEAVTAEQYTAPQVDALNRRMWGKFLFAWGFVGIVFAIWLFFLLRKRPARENVNTYRDH